jgi:hypothetical protein
MSNTTDLFKWFITRYLGLTGLISLAIQERPILD